MVAADNSDDIYRQSDDLTPEISLRLKQCFSWFHQRENFHLPSIYRTLSRLTGYNGFNNFHQHMINDETKTIFSIFKLPY